MNKLNSWFDDLNKLIQDCFLCHKHLLIISEKKKDIKFLTEDFFRFYQYQQWFMLIIQLAKIFENKKSQKRNILLLFNNIISGKYDVELISYFNNDSKYKQFIEKIKLMNSSIKPYQKIILKIINIRGKIYAHTDIERNFNFPSLEETKAILDLADTLYNNSRGFLYNRHTDFTKGLNNLTLRYIIKTINKNNK